MIMGTAAYMSPEQAAGKPVDKRADIWSFGVVLFEMLTGKRLFEGETVSHSLAAVLNKEPDLQQAPVKVRRLLQSCLEKDPRQRLRDIGDGALLLQEGESAIAPSRSRLGMHCSSGCGGVCPGCGHTVIYPLQGKTSGAGRCAFPDSRAQEAL